MTGPSAFPVLTTLVRLIRRAFPARVRARIRLLMFHWLDLTWSLPSGVRLQVASYGDWTIYNEIFVSAEYDEALHRALETASTRDSPTHIVDLGANVGYFTLRAVDRLRQARPEDESFHITAVEANARCAREFRARVFDHNGLAPRVTLVEGLVGKRTGDALFYEDSLFNEHGLEGDRGSFVDLSALLARAARIDLLKCDIEGAELLFLENYPDVLAKVQVAVFEFHRDLCDVERCKALLRDAGFTQSRVSRERSHYLVYNTWR